MLTAFTAVLYLAYRISGSAVLGYIFLCWAIAVGLFDIIYIFCRYVLDLK